MFSGLVQEVGKVKSATPKKVIVEVSKRQKPRLGDSVAINGVCLTVVRIKNKTSRTLEFDLSAETVAKTTLGRLKSGSPVNVESPLRLSDGLGGHIVQGHVDGTGRVRDIKKQGPMANIWFDAPESIRPYLADKGSITVDGVSLTVIKADKKGFSVALIPFTLRHTTLGNLKKGQSVNLEADMIAKYVRKYLKQ